MSRVHTSGTRVQPLKHVWTHWKNLPGWVTTFQFLPGLLMQAVQWCNVEVTGGWRNQWKPIYLIRKYIRIWKYNWVCMYLYIRIKIVKSPNYQASLFIVDNVTLSLTMQYIFWGLFLKPISMFGLAESWGGWLSRNPYPKKTLKHQWQQPPPVTFQETLVGQIWLVFKLGNIIIIIICIIRWNVNVNAYSSTSSRATKKL